MLKKEDWLLDPQNCPGFKDAKVQAHIESESGTIHHTEHLN